MLSLQPSPMGPLPLPPLGISFANKTTLQLIALTEIRQLVLRKYRTLQGTAIVAAAQTCCPLKNMDPNNTEKATNWLLLQTALQQQQTTLNRNSGLTNNTTNPHFASVLVKQEAIEDADL